MARENQPAPSRLKIEKLYVYPIKALRAVELDSAQVTKHGFPHDRRFMILHVQRDEKDNTKVTYKNIHVAHYPESVRFFPSLDTNGELVTITHKPANSGGERSLDFPLYPYVDDLEVVDVEMHKSPVQAYKMPQQYSDWLSSCYGFEVVLAYLGPRYRPVRMSSKLKESNDNTGTTNGSSWLSTAASYLPSIISSSRPPTPPPEITFADCAPYLLVNQTSVNDLQPRLPPNTEVDILKFRPNIIISGAKEPWDEDFWGQITIQSSDPESSETVIDCIHNCGRCKSINIDYDSGTAGSGPSGQMLKAMQKDRRVDPGMKYSPIFGRYSFLGEGCEGNEIRVGDEIVVTKRLERRTEFDWEGLCTLPAKK